MLVKDVSEENMKKKELRSHNGKVQTPPQNLPYWPPVPEKLWPDSLALACQNHKLGQSHQEAIILDLLGLAYLDLAWLGSQPEAGESTPLYLLCTYSR